MRKTTLLILFVFGSLLANAQIVKSIGVKGGVVMANQNWDYNTTDVDETSTEIFGLYVGLTSEILRKKNFTLTLDAAYVQKGTIIESEYQNSDIPNTQPSLRHYKNQLNFLTVYPAIKYNYTMAKSLSPYVFVGPRMDFHLISASLSDYDNESYKDVTFGLAYGLGVEYGFSKFSILLEAQHQPDLNTFYESKSLDNQFYLNKTNKAFILNLGVRYRL